MSTIQQLFPFNNPLVRRILGAQWKQGDEEDTWRHKAIDALVKRLKKEPGDQYGVLKTALNVKSENTPCVRLTKSQDGRIQVCHRKMQLHLMSCRVFRWPDLQQHSELSTSACCETPNRSDFNKVCVNPYHYNRVDRSAPLYPPVVSPGHQTEFAHAPISPGSQPGSPSSYFSTTSIPSTSLAHQSPPLNHQENHIDQTNYIKLQQQPLHISQHVNCQQPNYYSTHQSSVVPETKWYNAPIAQTFESQTPPPGYISRDISQQQYMAPLPMDITEDTSHFNISVDESSEHWCRITYAELNQKIGEPFKGSSSKVVVDGFTSPSVNNCRFSLGVLSNINRNSTIEMTRRAIRKGICLENHDNQIYVLNMSDSSIFFHSKNHNVENQLDQHEVVKIKPQVRQKIFDQKIFDDLVEEAIRHKDLTFQRVYSLIDHCIIKMSFVKGWGSVYHRQDVTATPCWIEIHLLKPCALIDENLRKIGSPSDHITSTS